MINPMKQHGAFSWNELLTDDLEGAKTFYSALFNWQCTDINNEMPYTLAKIGDNEVAGMMTTPPEAKGMSPMWGGYVTVDDVDESARLCETLGGKILVEVRHIPNVGRFCVISDPQGAMLTIITYV